MTRDFGDFQSNTSIDSSTWSGIDSANAYIKALMSGSKWGDVADPSSTTTELNYYIYDEETTVDGTYGSQPYEQEITAFEDAMHQFEVVANITFTESNKNDAHILWASLDDEDSEGFLGYAYAPEGGAYDGLATINYDEYSIEGEIEDG